ncbi:MAG: CotH kinase family protein [Planctomycetia bacterium]
MQIRTLLHIVAIFLGTVVAGRAHPVARADETSADAFFAGDHISRIEIRLAEGAADRLRDDPRSYVPCTLTIDADAVFEDVAIKLKGAAGSFQGLDDKPGFTVNIDRFRPGARFHGLDRFHLNNAAQDPSFLAEWLGAHLFLEAGVPAARVTHARVLLDDRDLGLYVFKEAIDRDFLERHFDDSSGNLYDGGTGVDLDELVERDEGKNGVPGADLKALVAACRVADPAQRQAAISARLDVDAFVTFMALELMAGHWDGSTIGHNNYRIYVDPANGDRIRFLPHGMDQIFGDPGAPILDRPPTIVAGAVMGVPEWRGAYRERLRDLLPLFAAEGAILPQLDSVAERLRPAVAETGGDALEAWEGAWGELRDRIVAREAHLREQAEAPEPEPIQFDGARRARLAGWTPRTDAGEATHDETEGDDGRSVLRIAVVGEPPSIASWRVAVPLPAGRYRFEGLAFGEGIEATEDDTGSGAGLRISGGQRRQAVDRAGEWTALGYEFSLEAAATVELVAELRATAGQVSFNAESLVLVRLSEP